ncbi:hypothetical protein AB4Y45_35330 [Paraburkholderia sp. EG287A]|uniref:hypothetical protein n=1 Tax=Paraburkholderia sp. EG287A TaxID=3237012 RepID=UPI0034D33491
MGPDVPWTLTSDQHPWPLRYHALAPVMSLFLDLPSPADTKLELPGIAADQAEHARVAVNQYFSNLLGSDNRTRGGQLDALSTWLDRMGQQEMSLGSADPWAHYEFSREALAQMTQFRSGVASQTDPQSRQVLSEVRNAIARITPLVQLMPTYETRLAWYNVLVQLKDGLAEYQSQATETDQKLLTAIDTYLATHPAVPQPAGDIPPRPQGFARAHAPAASSGSQAQTPSAVSTLQDAHTPAAMPPEKKQGSSLIGSLLVALFAVVTLGWVAMKIRGRNKGGLKLPAVATKKTP